MINACSYTDQGGRNNNEDYCAYRTFANGKGIYVLADGLGGHDSGEIASSHIVEFTIDNGAQINSFSDKDLLDLLDRSNKSLLEKQTEDFRYKNMRTTVVSVFTENNILKYYNVGDSRFYYFRNGKLIKQSKDHTVSQMSVDSGEIKYSEIRFSEDKNKLLKVLGDNENLNIHTIGEPIEMKNSDAFLICSDGFWEYVYETEMEIDLLKSISEKQWMEFMLKRLLLRVPDDCDNFSLMCSFVDQ